MKIFDMRADDSEVNDILLRRCLYMEGSDNVLDAGKDFEERLKNALDDMPTLIRDLFNQSVIKFQRKYRVIMENRRIKTNKRLAPKYKSVHGKFVVDEATDARKILQSGLSSVRNFAACNVSYKRSKFYRSQNVDTRDLYGRYF